VTTTPGALAAKQATQTNVDGQTITIDYLSAEGRNDRFADIGAECLRFKADVIAPDCHAAAGRSSRRPSSIARPEGNVTGTTVMTGSPALLGREAA
jgi:hypothetical protein